MQQSSRVAVSAAIISTLLIPALARTLDSGFDLDRGTKVLPPLQFKQLAIFPVIAQGGTEDGTRYLSLADGLKQKKVAVTEVKEGAQVNRVALENNSDRPLLLLGGELILGGQQDRVISQDTLVAPHQRTNLQVYCVEHGRWQGRREFEGAGGVAESKIRRLAKYGRDQGGVWGAVADKNAALGAAPSTGTYRNIATGPEGARAIQPYREAIAAELARLPQSKQMVGIIAAIHGRVVSMDIFSSPEIFASHRDRLLDSIFVSAASLPASKAPERVPSEGDIKSFVMKADTAPAEVILDDARGRTVQRHAKDVVSSAVEAKSSGKVQTVYKSYQANE